MYVHNKAFYSHEILFEIGVTRSYVYGKIDILNTSNQNAVKT